MGVKEYIISVVIVVVVVFWIILLIPLVKNSYYLYDRYKNKKCGALEEVNYLTFLTHQHLLYFIWTAGSGASVFGCILILNIRSILDLILGLLLLLTGFGVRRQFVEGLSCALDSQKSYRILDAQNSFQVTPELEEDIDTSQFVDLTVDLTNIRILFKEDFNTLFSVLDSAYKHCVQYPNNSGLTGEEFVNDLRQIEDHTKSIDLPASDEDIEYIFNCLNGLIKEATGQV